MQKPDKTFVIPTVTNIDGLQKCIKSIYKYHEKNSFRIILIDNSDENNYPLFKDSVHLYIKPYYNLGFSKSVNTGLRLFDTDYVVICNDDVEFINSKWWDGIIESFNKFPNVACVNPASIMDRNEKPRIPYKEEYTEEDYQTLLNLKIDSGALLRDTVIDTICMWCTVFKKETIERLGLFNERFYPGGGEDYDMNIRIYMHQMRALGVFNSWAWHWWGKTKDSVPSKALPQKTELRWNNLAEIWGENKDLFGRGGRTFLKPSDYKTITPL